MMSGTFIMVCLVKSSAISLSALTEARAGDGAMLTQGLSAGLAVMVGILVTGEASGGHMNPAVSVGMAVWGRIPLTSLPAYLLGQFLGAFSSAGILLLSWSSTIAKTGPAVMTSFPDLGETEAELGVDQGLATFLMVLVACSLEDQNHSPPSLLMGLTVATVTITMGQNAGASMNPAVDMMPRLMAALYNGDLSSFRKGGNFWMIPFLVPYLGSLIAVSVYYFFIERPRVTGKRSVSDVGSAEIDTGTNFDPPTL